MPDAYCQLSPKTHESWLPFVSKEFEQPYFLHLTQFLIKEIRNGVTIFPPISLIFHALNMTPFHEVKVVIIGQDPYHGTGQAHGLCFSVLPQSPIPPSLHNIFKELEDDLSIPMPKTGTLTGWAKQGVLLLNSVLTVRKDSPASHAKKGWERFTDTIIETVSEKKDNVIFLLWGKYAQDKGKLIDTSKHHVLTASHPSPLSAHNGFLGCKHFSKTNTLLQHMKKEPIQWEKTVYNSDRNYLL